MHRPASTSICSVEIVHGDIGARRGFYMALPTRLGGDGFAFLLQPMLQMSKVDYRKRDSYGNDFGVQEASVLGLGAYLGVTLP